jgi:CHRD domain/PEP-CTERM motif
MKKLSLLASAIVAASSVQAAIIQFDLIGTAGPGLLAGSEPSLPVASTASGGEINVGPNGGIFYDDASLLLTINVGWGSSQGFTDLTSNSTASHVHGATAAVNGLGFTQTAGVSTFNSVTANLTRSSNLATGGTISQTVGPLTAAQQTQLYDGKFYINIHTSSNTGGEIRGFMVPVPEPSTAVLAAMGVVGMLSRRRRQA